MRIPTASPLGRGIPPRVPVPDRSSLAAPEGRPDRAAAPFLSIGWEGICRQLMAFFVRSDPEFLPSPRPFTTNIAFFRGKRIIAHNLAYASVSSDRIICTPPWICGRDGRTCRCSKNQINDVNLSPGFLFFPNSLLRWLWAGTTPGCREISDFLSLRDIVVVFKHLVSICIRYVKIRIFWLGIFPPKKKREKWYPRISFFLESRLFEKFVSSLRLGAPVRPPQTRACPPPPPWTGPSRPSAPGRIFTPGGHSSSKIWRLAAYSNALIVSYNSKHTGK